MKTAGTVKPVSGKVRSLTTSVGEAVAVAAARGVADAPKVADGPGVAGVEVVAGVRVVDAPGVRVTVPDAAGDGVGVAVPTCP